MGRLSKSTVCRVCKHLTEVTCEYGELTAPSKIDECWRFTHKKQKYNVAQGSKESFVQPLDRSGRS